METERELAMSDFVDRTIVCVQCSGEFTFSVDDQEYHVRMQFEHEPKRCKPCRAERKKNSPGDGSGPGSSAGRRDMHEAVCAECGGVARVPFKPRGDKPVYCSNCFSKQRS